MVEKVQDVHDYSEGLHASIQFTICPTEDDMDVHVLYLYVTLLRDISCSQENTHLPNLDISLSPEYLHNKLIHLTINTTKPKVTTPKEQALGCLTRKI